MGQGRRDGGIAIAENGQAVAIGTVNGIEDLVRGDRPALFILNGRRGKDLPSRDRADIDHVRRAQGGELF